jgi:DNA-binding response OmpR family regulator
MFKECYEANNGIDGYNLYIKNNPHIILTDIEMPKLNGLDLCKKIRKIDNKTKIIITTAFSDEKYLLDAVELNLQRYIVKPITKRNLIPALRKAISNIKIENKLFIADEFYYNYDTSLFYYQNKVIQMTKKEILLLTLLIKNKNTIVSYRQIEQEVWNNKYMSKDSLRTTLGFLRKKIPFNTIMNISNMGYKINIHDKCK